MVKKRHLFFWCILRPLVGVFLFFRFGYRYQVAKELPETYIVLSNHNTDYDPLLVGMSFPRQMYFVASEHIARWKFAYKFIHYALEPIIRRKGSSAAAAVKEMLRAARAGANVCMFAEGVRSWDGVTCPILPATGKVIRSARCALVTYRIEGGYFASPMWGGASVRRGRLKGAVVNVYTAEQLAAMTVDEVNEAINRDLYEDAYARQLADPVPYKGKNLARKMENLLFVCPECGGIDTFHSDGDRVTCGDCGLSIRYTEYGMLEGAPFETLREFAAWQKEQVARAVADGAVYTAPSGVLTAVEKHEENLLEKGPVSLSAEKLVCGGKEFLLADIRDMAMHGQRAIVFSTSEGYFELIPDDGANALKFLLFYEACAKAAPQYAMTER